MNTIYWKPGSRFRCDAAAAHSELEAERARRGGYLSASDVLDVAESEDSAIHYEFEWDDSTAAHEYRLSQARHLTRSLIVVVEERPTRAYESIPLKVAAPEEDGPNTRGDSVYVSVQDVRQKPEWNECVLQKFRRDIDALRKRYQTVKQLSAVFSAIDEALEEVA